MLVRADMLTFRRTALIAGAVIVLFLLFGGAGSKLDRSFFHDRELEQRLIQTERNTEAALKELQKSTSEKVNSYDQEIRKLRTDRRILEKQIQQLRRLPDSAGVKQQLGFQYPYNKRDKFPAYVWQTWKVNYDDPLIDEQIREYMDSWRARNAGFVHEVMNDRLSQLIIRHLYMNIPRVVEAYTSMPEPILQADFFRYLILFARGGVYSDADTECLKPIPVWLPSSVDPTEVGLVVGIEADPDRPDWADWYARRIQFCQWTIQSKPGHPVLRNIIANITEQTLEKKAAGTLDISSAKDRGSSIMDWTGPGIWTDSVFEYLQENTAPGAEPVDWSDFTGLTVPKQVDDIVVLPITAFSPGIRTMGAQEPSDPQAYVHHHFGGSWKPEDERMKMD